MIISDKIARFIAAGMALLLLTISGCKNSPPTLTVYAGKGLKYAVDEAVQTFQQQQDVKVAVVYAGSNTLLTTLKETRKGDIFIPGSKSFIDQAGALVVSAHFIARHVPVFITRKDNPLQLKTYADLQQPGVRLAIGNQSMTAIGKLAASVLSPSEAGTSLHNVVVTASTVNELLQLLKNKKVDAIFGWQDMLTWEGSADLVSIALPQVEPREIWVAELSTSRSPQLRAAFADFMTREGRSIFGKHGFGL